MLKNHRADFFVFVFIGSNFDIFRRYILFLMENFRLWI